MSRRALSLALRLTVSLGLLALLSFVVAEPGELAGRLSTMRVPMLVAAFLLTAGDRALMAFKWWILLRARGVGMPLVTAVRAYFASSFAGLFLPVTLGADAVRLLASRQYGAADITASIVVERTLGAVSVVVVALAGCAMIAGTLANVALQPIVLATAAVGVTVALGFAGSLWMASRWADRPASRTAPSLFHRVATAYAAYARHPGALAAFFGLSIVESLVPAVIAFVVARGVGIDEPLWLFISAFPVALMVARLPVSLGGFGVQETSFVYLAGLLGLATGLAPDDVTGANNMLLATEQLVKAATRQRAGRLLPIDVLQRDFNLSDIAIAILFTVVAPRLRGELARLYGILANDPGELFTTIAHNFDEPETPWFQRKVDYDNIGSDSLLELRQAAKAAGEEFIRVANALLAGRDRDRNKRAPGGRRSRVVMGAYYFESDVEPGLSAARLEDAPVRPQGRGDRRGRKRPTKRST